jgi:L-cysteine desulfidase
MIDGFHKADFTFIYANSNKALFIAQKEYEQTTMAYIEARENHTQSIIDYDKAFSEEIAKLKGSEPVTILKELAKKNSYEYYENMLKSEQIKKKCNALRKGYEERINTIKKIMDTSTGKIN